MSPVPAHSMLLGAHQAAVGGGGLVAGYVANWDASDTATITSSGGLASAWADGVVGANDLSQATDTNKPTTGVTTKNGLNVLDWDGGDFMDCALLGTTDPLTVFMVLKVTSFSSIHDPMGAGTGGLICRVATSGKPELAVFNQGTVGTATTALTANTWAIIAANYIDATSYAFWLNGSTNGSGSHTRTLGGSTTYRVGSRNTGEGFLGSIGQIVTYNATLDSTDIATNFSVLNSKWGVY